MNDRNLDSAVYSFGLCNMSEPKSKKQKVAAENKQAAEEAAAKASPEEIVEKLLKDDTYGQTYCEQLGIDLKPDDADSLFTWLCCAQLFSSGLSEALTLKVQPFSPPLYAFAATGAAYHPTKLLVSVS